MQEKAGTPHVSLLAARSAARDFSAPDHSGERTTLHGYKASVEDRLGLGDAQIIAGEFSTVSGRGERPEAK
jgi:hypothetical protein